MKRQISVFVLLLSVFLVARAASALQYYALSTHPCTITDCDGTVMTFSEKDADNGGYYYGRYKAGGYGVTDLSINESGAGSQINVSEPAGFRFKGWYTKKSGWTSDEAYVSQIDTCIESSLAIGGATIKGAGQWSRRPTIVAKFVPLYVITTAVSPASSGTVKGGGTYEEGTNATLTATANAGWTFEKWSDGDTSNPRTVSNIRATKTYTAVFVDQKAVKVSLSSFGRGTVTVSPQKEAYQKGDSLTLTVKPDNGYAFVRWSDGNTDNPRKLIVGGNLDLRAIVEPKSSLVTFSGGTGALVDVSHKRVSYGATYGELALCTRTGYTFAGWYTVDGTNVMSTTLVTVTAPQTLLAHWTANSYRLTFDAAGGRASSTSATVTYDSVYEALPTCTRTGYAFDGWYLADGTKVENGAKVAITSAQTLVAHWTANTYKVTFDANGGKASAASATVTYDAAYGMLPTCTRTGHAFGGWWTGETGGTQVKSNTVVTITSDQTLYAHWTANTYKVTFDANGGSSPTASATVTYGSTYKSLPTPTWAGHTFAGWWTAKEGGSQVTETTAVEITAAQTLYARWEANTYTVRFVANGGDVPDIESKVVTYDQAYGDLAVCTRTGYGFAGWWTDRTYGTEVRSNTVVKITSEQMLYAHWTANRYEVTFDANGGNKPSVASVTVTYDSTYGELAACTRTGYDFTGWWTEPDGGTRVVERSTKVAITEAQTLYAHWTPKTYRVTFFAAGGTASTSSKDVTYDSTYGDLATCTRTGYAFDGWFTEGGAKVESGTKVAITAAQTLVAHWTPNEYAVTFDGNGGNEPSFATTNVTYGSTYGTLPTCTRTGHSLAGWYTSPSGGTKVEGSTKVEITSAQTLYAHWTANTYAVTLDPNGGSGGSCLPSTYTFSEKEQRSLTLSSPTRKGHLISAWTVTGASDGNPQVSDDRQLVIPAGTYGDLTLVPTWKAKTFRVKLDLNGGIYVDAAGEHQGEYTLPETEKLVYGSNNLNRISVPVERAQWRFLGYAPAGDTSILFYDAQGQNTDASQYWTAAYPVGTYSCDGENESVIELKALWQDMRPRHKIVVKPPDDRQGTVEDVGGDYVDGSNVVLTATANTGYSFASWNREGDKDPVSTKNPYSFAAETNGTYIAMFTGNVYTVTFHAEGGASDPKPQAVTFGKTYGTLPTVSRDGHEFEGWKDDKGGSVDANTPVTIAGDHDLYATWSESIAVVLDCTNLEFTVSRNAQWSIFREDHVVGSSCMRLQSSAGNDLLQSEVAEAGVLSFNWKVSNNARLYVSMNGDDIWSAQDHTPSKWTASDKESVEIFGPCKLAFYCFDSGSVDCRIDNVSWTPKSTMNYEVSVVSGGNGSVNPELDHKAYLFGTAVAFSATPDAGYAFAKWSDGSTESNRTVTVSSNAVYTASFTACVYRVTFDANGGEGGATEIWATYNEPLQKLESLPTRAHHALLGFFDAETGGTKYCNADGTAAAAAWDKTADATLFAQWQEDAKYTLKVEVAEGSHGSVAKSPGDGVHYVGTEVTITATPDAGYAFEKWSDGSTESSRTVMVSSDAAYTASFTACVYRVTLDACGGTGGATEIRATYGEPLPKLDSLPTLAHHALSGFFDAETGGAKYYSADGTAAAKWDKAMNATLFAQWKKDSEYELNVSVAEGSHGSVRKDPSQNSYYKGTLVAISATPDAGYAFEKWSDGSTDASRTVTVSSDAAYTASFTACVYRVTLDARGGTGGAAEIRATYGEPLPKLEALPQLANYTLLGFYDQETDGKKYYNADGTSAANWDKAAGAALSAHWQENDKYALTVKSADTSRGTVAKEPAQDLYYVGTQVAISATPTGGYAFEKWSDGSTENPRQVQVVSQAEYVANFTNCGYVVRFNADGGTVSPSEKSVTFGKSYGELPTPQKTGCNFVKWTLPSGGDVMADTIVAIAGDHELRAVWTQDLGIYSAALDCSNLKFDLSAEGWSACNEDPHKGSSCLRSQTPGAELTATIKESGTLTFWWRGNGGDSGSRLKVMGNEQETLSILADETPGWEIKTIRITASADAPITFKFTCDSSRFYQFDIDDVTWTPDVAQ